MCYFKQVISIHWFLFVVFLTPLFRLFIGRWALALELADKYDYPQVEGLLTRMAVNLINKDKKLQAVELYRIANKPQEAALLTGFHHKCRDFHCII